MGGLKRATVISANKNQSVFRLVNFCVYPSFALIVVTLSYAIKLSQYLTWQWWYLNNGTVTKESSGL